MNRLLTPPDGVRGCLSSIPRIPSAAVLYFSSPVLLYHQRAFMPKRYSSRE